MNERCNEANAPVNLDRLKELAGDAPEELRTLIDLYAAQASELIGQLETAIDTRSVRDVERLAHTLAGSSVTCGMTAIVAPLRELERLGRAGELGGATQCHAQARQELDAINRFFKQHLQSAPPL